MSRKIKISPVNHGIKNNTLPVVVVILNQESVDGVFPFLTGNKQE